MDALPLALASTRHGFRGIAAFGTYGHAAVAHVIDVAIHGAHHDVLGHELELAERLFHFAEVVSGHHVPAFLHQLEGLGVRNRGRVGFAVLVRHDGSVVRVLVGDVFPVDLVAGFYADFFSPTLEGTPFAAEFVFLASDFLFEDVGGVGAAGGHGHGRIAAMSQHGEWHAEN